MDGIIQIVVFLVLLAIGVFAGRANERKHFRELEESERALDDIVASCSSEAAERGALVRGTLVVGSVVIAEDYFKRVAASLKSLVGGSAQLRDAARARPA